MHATDAGTQAAASEVLGNRDLVRHMMSRAHEASRLLSVAGGIRNNEECARLYEEWSSNGCPREEGDEHARRCLQSIGGRDGDFCLGTYDGEYWRDGRKVRMRSVTSSTLLAHATRLLHTQPGREHVATEVFVDCFPIMLSIRRTWPGGVFTADVRSIATRVNDDYVQRNAPLSEAMAHAMIGAVLASSVFDAGKIAPSLKDCPVLHISRWHAKNWSSPQVTVSRVRANDEEDTVLMAWRG